LSRGGGASRIGGKPSRRGGWSRGGVPPGEEAGVRRALFAARYSPHGKLVAALVSPARHVDALPRYRHAALLNIALLNTCPGTNSGWTNFELDVRENIRQSTQKTEIMINNLTSSLDDPL
jgi:hypothetical protein